MQRILLKYDSLMAALLLMASLMPGHVAANGPVGEHVNNLSAHLNDYAEEVDWLIGKVDGIVESYEQHGAEAAGADAVVDHWEAVDFHAAVETNYVPIYASIWQGLYGVKQAIDEKEPVAEVRLQQAQLERALWQGLGAVKLAAQYQQKGLLAQVNTRENAPITPTETLETVQHRLDRVVAKYAEKLPQEATGIVHDTYLNLFEGVEGALIEQDAELVEDLEKDFNVTLPQAIDGGASVEQVRQVVRAMQEKLARASTLLIEAEKDRKDVF